MATHSSTLAWKIPWTEKPGRLQSMGSQRVWHDWATSLSLFTFMHWRRKWQPTSVLLLPSMGLDRVGHDWHDLAAAAAAGEGIGYPLQYFWASLIAQMIKNLLAMWETWVPSPGWEDPLEKRMATYSCILAWRSPWTEEPGRLQSMGSQKFRHNWVTFTFKKLII